MRHWLRRHRFAVQAAALVIGSLAPFALYGALVNALTVPAILLFAVLALVMLIILWVG